MKIKRKILVFPALLLVAFLSIYFILTYFNSKNKLLLKQTKEYYLPSIEISIRLHQMLTEIQHSMQNAVSSAEISILTQTDSIAGNFNSLCNFFEHNINKDTCSGKLCILFNHYYKNARTISEEMFEGDISPELGEKITLMLSEYNKIHYLLLYLEKRSREQSSAHFNLMESNSNKAEFFNIIVSFIGFITSLIISFFISSAIVKPIKELNEILKTNEEKLKQANEELLIANESLYAKNEDIEKAFLKLKNTQAQLVQSEKLATVGILTAGIAHEINNPLNFIQGGKIAIENYLSENVESHFGNLMPFLDIIETGIQRTSAIVDSINRFNRKSETNLEICNVHSIIDNCLSVLHDQLNSKIEITKNYTEKNFTIKGNEGKLHQVFLNIIENARQSISNHGTISINTRINEKKVNISIIDSGCGISKENLSKIMDPFFTTKEPGEGTGLGLTIAYNIIREHHGTIKYLSEPGNGTTMIIYLPLSEV